MTDRRRDKVTRESAENMRISLLIRGASADVWIGLVAALRSQGRPLTAEDVDGICRCMEEGR